jgi:hypothetical protein
LDINELYRCHDLLSSGRDQKRRQYLIRMVGESDQVLTALGPLLPANQFFTVHSLAPVHRITVFTA